MKRLRDAGTGAGRSEGAIQCHAGCYRENLSRGSEAMLQYERVWLQQQLRALRDCEGHPVLMARVGGEDRLREVGIQLHLSTTAVAVHVPVRDDLF